MTQDYYQTLGVAQNASPEDIKKAYRKMAMKHHPDRNPDDTSAEAKFKDVQKAYDTLSDTDKRKMYDHQGHANFEQSAQNGGHEGFGGFSGFGGFGSDLGDIFSTFFGGGNARQGGAQERSRGDDVSYSLEITLEQAAFGYDAQIKVPAWDDCTDCGGTGAEKGSKINTCGYCKGHGAINIRQGMFAMQQTCPQCQGAGKMFEKPCRTCHTTGKVRKQKTLQIRVPAGIETGMRIRSTNNGKPGLNGGPYGDMYLEIQVKTHDTFERDGSDLHCDAPIPFSIATLGGEVKIPTLSGNVDLNIPEGTQNGQVFRLRNKGIRSLRSEVLGDLYVHVQIEVPVALNHEQKKLLQSFAESMNGDSDSKALHHPKTKGFMDKLKDFFD